MNTEHGQSLPLVLLCAWCPNLAERTEAEHRAGKVVSHTICLACAEKMGVKI